MIYERQTDGTTEPVKFLEAQEHLRLDDEADENTVNLYLKAARESFEYHSNFVVTSSQTWKLYLDEWYTYMRIAKSPILSISSVEYYDVDDALQTYDAANYFTVITGKESYVQLKSGVSTPSLSDRKHSVVVTFTAGYTSIDDVPSIAKQAILLLAGHFYENRQENVVMSGVSATSLPQGFRSLVSRMKIWR